MQRFKSNAFFVVDVNNINNKVYIKYMSSAGVYQNYVWLYHNIGNSK